MHARRWSYRVAMFEDLDAVDWAQLSHAYGKATDVPALLVALREADDEVRARTMRALYGNVYHQGTRYPASAAVVPFVLQLLDAEETPTKEDLLSYLARLVAGPFTVRHGPEYVVEDTYFRLGREVRSERVGDGDRQYLRTLARVYDEVEAGLPVLMRSLDAPAMEERAAAAYVIGALPNRTATTLPLLLRRLSSEPVAKARISVVFALGELQCRDALLSACDDADAAVRLMAAAQLLRERPTHAAVKIVVASLAAPIPHYEGSYGAHGASTADAAHALTQVPRTIGRAYLDDIANAVGRLPVFDALPIVAPLLDFAFEVRDRPLEDGEVDAPQQRALGAIVRCAEFWPVERNARLLERYGLQLDRAAMASLARIEIEHNAEDEIRTGRGLLAARKAGALDCFERALQSNPYILDEVHNPAAAWFAYARMLAKEDRVEEARSALLRAATLDPVARTHAESLPDMVKSVLDSVPT